MTIGALVFWIIAGRDRRDRDCEAAGAQAVLAAQGQLRFSTLSRSTQSPWRIPEEDRDLAASLIAGAVHIERIGAIRMNLVAGRVRAVLQR